MNAGSMISAMIKAYYADDRAALTVPAKRKEKLLRLIRGSPGEKGRKRNGSQKNN